ncbi:YjbH domain-containing protein [Aliidiomarina sp. Khilg15.8]
MSFTLKTLTVAIALGLTSISAAQADTQQGVSVDVNSQAALNWNEPVRLRQVLEQAHSNANLADVHWPSARLIDIHGTPAIEQRRQRILDDLDALAERWADDAEKIRVVEAIQAQVASWQLGAQPVSGISLEAARQRIGDNPLLPSGQYVLYAPTRQSAVYVFGLVGNSGAHKLQPGQTIRGYIEEMRQVSELLSGYDKDEATRITPRGERTRHAWNYYNADAAELQPQDILWLGFSDFALPGDFEHLNDDIPELLSHFVPSQVPGEAAAGSRMEPRIYDASHWSRRDYSPTRSHYGGIGLMQTPTARMADEGTVSLTYSDMKEYRRYSVSLQVLSWLEAVGFYTRIPNRLYSNFPGFSNNQMLTDKGFNVKARVWQESYWLPEVSVGFRDLAGTGLFDSEYVVANKRAGAFDFSLGLGFGRMGTRDSISNPFCELTDSFCSRASGFSGKGGEFSTDKWFKGPAAFFGGVEWQTPHDPLRVKLEYNSNDYTEDRAGVPIVPKTPWNLGVSYRVTDWLDLQASYERGDTLMFNFTLRTNFNTMSQVKVQRDRVEPRQARTESLDEVNWQGLSRGVRRQDAISNARFATPSEDKVIVTGYPRRFRDNNEAIDRSARVLAAELPDSVKEYEFVTMSVFEPAFSTKVDADAFKARVRNEDLGKSVEDTEELFVRTETDYVPDEGSDDWRFNPKQRFGTGWGMRPFFNQDFGAPETFHHYQLGVTAFASRWLMPKLEVFGEVGFNIANNYDFNFISSPDNLPPVRTDVRAYISNDVWLETLQAVYYERFTDGFYGMAYGGVLERMFGGVGVELMYRPLDKPWAIGMDINRVRQRDFDGWTGFRDYETTTGFVSLYYQMPWLEDSLLQVDAGRFLAKDKGVRVTYQRRFDSGLIAGAYASFTNVSAEEYGEGSFTKGFFLSIPFDLMGVRPTRQRVSFNWVPLSRNGGQPLQKRMRLYDITDDRAPFYQR